ncbi:MAG: hypothetical protein U1E76_09185 [Planctomycetota bacterium]
MTPDGFRSLRRFALRHGVQARLVRGELKLAPAGAVRQMVRDLRKAIMRALVEQGLPGFQWVVG